MKLNLKNEINNITYLLCIKNYEIIFYIDYKKIYNKNIYDYYIINDNEKEFKEIENYINENNIKTLNEKIINDIKNIIFN